MSSPLLQVSDIESLHATIKKWRDAGERIAFVPTMGNLHEGHLQLVDIAKKQADRCVVSIFVNPTQFGENEDLAQYPRTQKKDCEQLETRGADLVFLPSVDAIYGNEVNTDIHVPAELNNILCGKDRPGHFDGVATVVAKLFNAVKPDVAVFGNKDYQQVQVIRWLVSHLNLKIKIIAAPIIREEDGLAMSSRNQYLSEAQRSQASRLQHVLQSIVAELDAGRRDYKALCDEAALALNKTGWKVDYIEILRPNLTQPSVESRDLIILAAAYLGKPRLIDNLECHILA